MSELLKIKLIINSCVPTVASVPAIKYTSLDIHQNIDISIIIIVCNTFNKHTLHQITPSITQKETVSKVTDTVS